MADSYENIIWDNPIGPRQHLRVSALVDQKNWVLEPKPNGDLISGLTLSFGNKIVPSTKRSLRELRQSVEAKVRSSVRPKKSSPPKGFGAVPVLKPTPYTLGISAVRIDGAGRLENVCSWSFSGELQPGGSFYFRTDAMIELMRDDVTAPYYYVLTIRVRTQRNRRIENLNAATSVLYVGNSMWELVSKEILALHSDFFAAFYYGGFAEAVSDRPCKVHPIITEDPQDFQLAMVMLLQYVHYKSLSHVTPKNAPFLISVVERYQFSASIVKHIDNHLVQFCRATQDVQAWDDAILAADTYDLPETMRHVLPLYKNPHDLSELVHRTRGQLSASLLQRIFDAYRHAWIDKNFRRSCYAHFSFAAGRVIVQLNRVGLPKTSAVVVQDFSDGPRFYWDAKKRLVSCETTSRRLFCGEAENRNSVPDGTWALIHRILRDGPHYILTKTRPEGNYLGFVVAGDQFLKGDRCISTGLYQID